MDDNASDVGGGLSGEGGSGGEGEGGDKDAGGGTNREEMKVIKMWWCGRDVGGGEGIEKEGRMWRYCTWGRW